MQTKICEINEESLRYSKELIESGGLVAFPTETVYGLGACAYLDGAVKEVFKVKGRPNDNPLIVHVHKDYDISALIDYEPAYVKKLRDAFLPGPLTLVYRSTSKVSPYVSCGLDTLAIRIPSHKGAQEFLKYVNLPIVAPSANLSKHISPVTAMHVYDDFNGSIPLILEGGKCEGGIESTVCDVTGEVPMILRAGLITREMIASVAGECLVYTMKEGEKPKSPGMVHKHYSPKCRTMIFKSGEIDALLKAYEAEKALSNAPCILCEGKIAKKLSGYSVLNLGDTEEEMAANLYYLLREGEKRYGIIIALEPEKKSGVMEGVMNRLSRACQS